MNAVATGSTTEKAPNVTTAACTAGRAGNDACAIANAKPFARMPLTNGTTRRNPALVQATVHPRARGAALTAIAGRRYHATQADVAAPPR